MDKVNNVDELFAILYIEGDITYAFGYARTTK